MPIIKRIRSLGGSAGILIPKPILDQFDWSVGTPVIITNNGDSVVIAPVPQPKAAKKVRAA